MKLTVFSSDGTTSSEKDFAGLPVFEGDKGLQAVKEVVVAINANNRQGTHSTKTRGEVRGGRFIAGLSGEQFALPEAVGLLRGIRRKPGDGEMVAVCGADPLNLVGAIVAGEKVPALTGSRILYRDGTPVATLVSGNFAALEPLDAALEWKAKGFLLRGGECEPTAAQTEAQRPQ